MRKWMLVSLLFVTTLAAESPKLAGIDSTANQLMKDWNVPGLAIAVIDHGEVVLSKGYGFRDVEHKLPVTSQTLFAIGSISKSFTVSMMNALADEGKLDWTRPVREYLPSFQMYDPVATAGMTVLDLVTHRSGLPRHDTVWYGTTFTRKELFDRLRYLEPNKAFRETYQYQNLMFMTAGYLAGEVMRDSWEHLVQQRVFQPLGMKNSNFSINDSQKAADFAFAYSKQNNEVEKIPFHLIDEIGPAGSINSNVDDMAKYVKMHLGKGKPVMSERSWTMMTSPQMSIQGARNQRELGDSSYGMALNLSTYRGHKIVSHGGGIDGFSALMSFLPDDQVGMIILTNLNGNPMTAQLSYAVYDALLGLPPIDWPARLKARPQPRNTDRTQVARVEGTHPSHPLEAYAGDYSHPGYGKIHVDANGTALKLTFNGMAVPLTHFHYDVFEGLIKTTSRAPVKFSFRTGLDGKIQAIASPLEPQVKDIVFERVAKP